MGTQFITKAKILYYMSWIYFFAFSSLYIQLPGLYGTNGVTPVHALENNVPKDFADFLKSPSILRFAQLKQLSLYDSMEIMIIVNIVLSLFAILFSSFRCFTSFSVFWISYLSVYQYGQVFLYFQWDSLLLEAGFLCILLAQSYFFILPIPRFASSDSIVIWLFKWLLFRLMFASGIVKLQSNCPSWWNLNALYYHFQSQCIPTPAAYYFHNLPGVLLQFGVVATFVIEVIVPFLFFIPLRGIRLFSFYTQVLLQIMIIISGNYNFFNLLTIVLSYSLLEDEDFGFKKTSRGRRPTTVPGHILSFVIVLGVFFLSYSLTDVTISNGSVTGFKLAFTKNQFTQLVEKIVPNIIYLATLLFAFKLLSGLAKAVSSDGCMKKIWNLSMVLFIGMISVCVFTSSIISIGQLDRKSIDNLPEQAKRVYMELETLQLTNSYGLFRRMTGVPKRPEIILEGAMSDQGPWNKFEFYHKPTDMSKIPSIVAPHQPRLDWQMWFAALSNPEDNPWLYSVIYRILSGEKSVIDLLESLNMKEKPKFIRASLFDYEFTDQNSSSKTWWTRTRKSIYINPLSLQSPELTKVITKNGLLKKPKSLSTKTVLIDYKDLLREKIGQPKDIYPAVLVIMLIKITQALFLR